MKKLAGATLAFLKSCVSSPLNALLTVLVLAALAVTVVPLWRWALFDAVWSGGPQTCQGAEGACWPFVKARWRLIVYGNYPIAEHWRVDLAALTGGLGLALLFLPKVPHKMIIAVLLLIPYPLLAALLLRGGLPGLPVVPTQLWGGLMVTAVASVWTIGTSIPLGLLLAFARRSSLPVVAYTAAGFIEFVRGLPLLGVLFLAIVLFPFFVPPGLEFDKLLRALIAYTIYDAAILAEIFRGGLQAIPSHQWEAGTSLGLKRRQILWLVVIPQVVTICLPGIVGASVMIVKETTTILIVGLFDFLGVLQAGTSDPAWLVGEQVPATAYFFAGVVFWAVCFAMSRYSARLERSLRAGRAT